MFNVLLGISVTISFLIALYCLIRVSYGVGSEAGWRKCEKHYEMVKDFIDRNESAEFADFQKWRAEHKK